MYYFIFATLHRLLVYYVLTKWQVFKQPDSLVDRALRRYRRGHLFKPRSGQKLFWRSQMYIFATKVQRSQLVLMVTYQVPSDLYHFNINLYSQVYNWINQHTSRIWQITKLTVKWKASLSTGLPFEVFKSTALVSISFSSSSTCFTFIACTLLSTNGVATNLKTWNNHECVRNIYCILEGCGIDNLLIQYS